MISVLLFLVFIQFATCAVPLIERDHEFAYREPDTVSGQQYVGAKKHEPMFMTVDGMDGVLYDIPEYEDPDLIDYQLSAMGGSPSLSLLQLAKKQFEDKDKYIPPKEKFASLKESLDEVISRLETVRTKLEKGAGDVNYADIEKSIHELKKLEHNFRPSIGKLMSAIRQTMSISSPVVKTSIVTVKRKQTSKPKAVNDESLMSTVQPSEIPEVEEEASPIPAVVEEASTIQAVKEEETMPKAPSAMELYKGEKINQQDSDDGKIYQKKKWTWKSSSFV